MLILIMLVALLTRLIGLGWSLPHTYEEATPLRVAVSMWGWDHNADPTLNPAFFNYPSFSFYVHFLAQGILFLVLKLTGSIASAADWYFLYLTDPTRQYMVSRAVEVGFGVLTVLVLFKAVRAASGTLAGATAALLLATNPFHVARSQMIEVDVPLTFFFTMAVYAFVRIAQEGRRSDYVVAGLAVGLATSCKYTGVVLIPALVVTHLVCRQARDWRRLLLSIVVSAATFAITSPYVFLDWNHFYSAFSLEREHMSAGHFGISDTAAPLFYARSLALRLVGIPGLAFGVMGAIQMVRTDRKAALSVLAPLVIYLAVIMTWTMKADAYAMPVLPIMLGFAAIGLVATARYAARFFKDVRAERVALACLVTVLVAIQTARIHEHREAAQHDVRTDAQNWVESNLPSGACVVGESYGPDILQPTFLLQLNPALRERLLARWQRRPIYAFLALPMFQSHPERSAKFYDVKLYPDADYVITTGSIGERYRKDPAKFAAQLEFYRQLDIRCKKLREFGQGTARVSIYQTIPREPFGRRPIVSAPPEFVPGTTTGREAGFYFSMGANAEYFRHLDQAAASYRFALVQGSADRQVVYASAFGYARCLGRLGRTEEARTDLTRLEAGIKDRQLAAAIGRLIQAMAASP